MRILKFGGTSVGSAERMHSVAELINDGHKKIVVLSAVTGTTNALVEIGDYLVEKDLAEAKASIEKLHEHYKVLISKLYSKAEGLESGKKILDLHFTLLKSYLTKDCGVKEQREILAEGELLSTQLFQSYLEEIGRKSVYLSALDFMVIDADNEPSISYLENNLNPILAKHTDVDVFVTQGYICRNEHGEVDNLKRGGSDYTATLIGAALRAEEIQIWTDIDGMHNNDPRIVKRTFPVREISFDEAAELAYFGAKILHPTCIRPAQDRDVPVKLLNTMQPSAVGTVIKNSTSDRAVTAVAAKDNITAIKIKSTRMLLAYGFLRRVFEVFERFKTPIDVITTSEVAVSLTIDDATHLDEIIAEVNKFGTVEVEHKQSIVCIVGNFEQANSETVNQVFNAIANIPVRMISLGGSRNNITVVIKTEHKHQALEALNESLFAEMFVV
jgi:aspartate kinase